MREAYIPILVLAAIVVLTAVALPILSHIVSPQRPTKIKGSPYESGMPPIGTAHERFSVKFYLVAISFILFDLEAIFLIPWAGHFRQLSLAGFIGGLVFILILALGLVYEWKRGAFQWD